MNGLNADTALGSEAPVEFRHHMRDRDQTIVGARRDGGNIC